MSTTTQKEIARVVALPSRSATNADGIEIEEVAVAQAAIYASATISDKGIGSGLEVSVVLSNDSEWPVTRIRRYGERSERAGTFTLFQISELDKLIAALQSARARVPAGFCD